MMGAMKQQMMHEQEQREEATRIAVDAGVLKSCPYHGEVYDPLNGDNTPAYKLGNYRFSRGELNVEFSSRPEMLDAIKAAIEDAGMECGYCAKD
jgi:hypothetical protein